MKGDDDYLKWLDEVSGAVLVYQNPPEVFTCSVVIAWHLISKS